jgi:hypothetical protein
MKADVPRTKVRDSLNLFQDMIAYIKSIIQNIEKKWDKITFW